MALTADEKSRILNYCVLLGLKSLQLQGTTATTIEDRKQEVYDAWVLEREPDQNPDHLRIELAYTFGGSTDGGNNRTRKTVEDALNDIYAKITNLKDLQNKLYEEVQDRNDKLGISEANKASLIIKGFSRGGTAAADFAYRVSMLEHAELLNIKLALFDPVHGGGKGSTGRILRGSNPLAAQPHKKSLTSEGTRSVINAVRLLPVSAGPLKLLNPNFTPQAVRGAQKVCIIYGADAAHSSGQYGEYSYKGAPLEGNGWNAIDEGLWAVESVNETDFDLFKEYSLGLTPQNVRQVLQPNEIKRIDTPFKLKQLFENIWNVKKVKLYRLLGASKYKVKMSRSSINYQNRYLEVLGVCADIIKDGPLKTYLDKYQEWFKKARSMNGVEGGATGSSF